MVHDASAVGSNWLDRIAREARLLAALTHPNIATVYGLDEVEGLRYIVMELVPGETLARRLTRGPRPAEPAAPHTGQNGSGTASASHMWPFGQVRAWAMGASSAV